jgi:hypothetical protein
VSPRSCSHREVCSAQFAMQHAGPTRTAIICSGLVTRCACQEEFPLGNLQFAVAARYAWARIIPRLRGNSKHTHLDGGWRCVLYLVVKVRGELAVSGTGYVGFVRQKLSNLESNGFVSQKFAVRRLQ